MTQTIDGATWEPRYRAALATDDRDAFMQISAEMEATDEPLWAAFYDLATDSDAEFRAELRVEIEHDFASYHAKEEWADMAYRFDLESCTPDSDHWIERRTADIVAGRGV